MSKIDHQANRQQLYDQVDNCDFIVIPANRFQQRSSDTAYKFRQDSNFLYLTGLFLPNLVMVADLKNQQEWLILPALTPEQIVFDGGIDQLELARLSGLEVMDSSTGWQRLKTALNRIKQPKVGVAKYPRFRNLSENDARRRLATRLASLRPKPELVDLTMRINRLRAIKSPAEIKLVQQAIGITAEALDDVRGHLSEYEFEYEIEADITRTFRRHNSVHAYEPIVAGGVNALTLHYIDNSSRLNQNELILIDVGAEVEGYAADITRTYPISGRANKRQQDVISAVKDIQAYAISLIKPGFSLLDYVRQTEEYTKKIVNQLGLKQPVRTYLPHAISHGLGLDVHDRLAHDEFRSGMVLTVEPGIYIKEEAIGVRLEDDVLVIDSGAKILSKDIP